MYLAKESIEFGYEAADWRDAVRQAGKLLLNAGAITESYIDAMINMVEAEGAYMLVAPGVAMPHARPQDGALKNGISYLTLKTPVFFPQKDDNPITLLIGVAAIDNRVHLKVMRIAAAALKDDNELEKLKNISDTEYIFHLLNG